MSDMPDFGGLGFGVNSSVYVYPPMSACEITYRSSCLAVWGMASEVEASFVAANSVLEVRHRAKQEKICRQNSRFGVGLASFSGPVRI